MKTFEQIFAQNSFTTLDLDNVTCDEYYNIVHAWKSSLPKRNLTFINETAFRQHAIDIAKFYYLCLEEGNPMLDCITIDWDKVVAVIKEGYAKFVNPIYPDQENMDLYCDMVGDALEHELD